MGAGAAPTARGSDALKLQLEETRPGDRVDRVGRDVPEAESLVERLGGRHLRHRVQAYAPVADAPRFHERARSARARPIPVSRPSGRT